MSTGQGLLGNNMFAYCRNNPVCRVDISGTEDAVAYNDGEITSDDDLTQLATSGGISPDVQQPISSNVNISEQSGWASDSWCSGTFNSGYDSMMYHYNKHVVQEGLSNQISVEQYTQDALSFSHDNASILTYTYNYKYGNASWNWHYSPGRGGMFTSNGQIITFWYRSME